MFRNNYWASLQLVLILLIVFNITNVFSTPTTTTTFVKKKSELPVVSTVPNRFESKYVDRFNTKYDVHFKKAAKRYFGMGTDWRWFKSQGMAESNLNPDAVSPVKAKGIMQIMDPTWRDITRKNKEVLGNVYEARWNIQAGIYYNSYLYGQWSSPRPEADRLALMFASYNAGLGNILKAQKVCKEIDLPEQDCNKWEYIRLVGNVVDSWKEEETLGYVTRIFKFMDIQNF